MEPKPATQPPSISWFNNLVTNFILLGLLYTHIKRYHDLPDLNLLDWLMLLAVVALVVGNVLHLRDLARYTREKNKVERRI